MKKNITLEMLPVGQIGTVREIKISNSFKNRIYDFGIYEGAEISALFSSPFGNPRAYGISGTVFALRNDDAGCILIETEEHNGE